MFAMSIFIICKIKIKKVLCTVQSKHFYLTLITTDNKKDIPTSIIRNKNKIIHLMYKRTFLYTRFLKLAGILLS